MASMGGKLASGARVPKATSKNGFMAGTPIKPAGKKGGGGLMKTGAYPDAVKGGGMTGTASKGGGTSGVTAHPMSRKPKAR